MKEHNRHDLEKHRLITAQRYRFLYTPQQFIYKPIKHLLYTKGIDHGPYDFETPFLGKYIPVPVHTVEPYNPIPKMFIPHKYRDIIPQDPLYTDKGVFIVPGSREWFTYMYNVHINLPPPPSKAELHTKKKRDDNIKWNEELREEAVYHGTSFNRINRRNVAKHQLTSITHNLTLQ